MSKKNTLFMETTRIGVGKTVSQIQEILGESGCKGVMILYNDGEVESLCFQLDFAGKEVAYRLPCRWESVYRNFMDRRNAGYRLSHKMDDDVIQSKRVAWRQTLRWVEAQLAFTSTDMVKIEEVFLPYMQMSIKGETFFERVESKGLKMIGFKEGSIND